MLINKKEKLRHFDTFFAHGAAGGFTLIELLVVIAIIVLLVSILVPSLKKAKDIAKNAVCMNSQRALVQTTSMYCMDHNGDFPFSTNDTKDPQKSHERWMDVIDDAMGKSDKDEGGARVCPGGQNFAYDIATDSLLPVTDTKGAWIAPNISMCRRKDKYQDKYGVANQVNFQRAGEIMLITDAGGNGDRVGNWQPRTGLRFRHQDGKGINIGFLDSHVESWNYDSMDLYEGNRNLLGEDNQADLTGFFGYLPWGEARL